MKLLSYHIHIINPELPIHLKAPCMSSKMDQVNLLPRNLKLNFPEMSISNSFDTDSDGVILGVLAVLSWMTPSIFYIAFVAPDVEGI